VTTSWTAAVNIRSGLHTHCDEGMRGAKARVCETDWYDEVLMRSGRHSGREAKMQDAMHARAEVLELHGRGGFLAVVCL
jgi:hypothetical protein